MVNVYANGVGAEKFGGVFDNTEIFHKLADLTKVCLLYTSRCV